VSARAVPSYAVGALVDRLVGALGADCVVTDPAAIAPRLTEWRRLYTGTADVLVTPRTVDQVAAALAVAHDLGAPVTPQGGRTGLVGGGVPHGGVVLSLERLSRIRALDVMDATITVEAGVTLASAKAAAADQGMLLPLSIASEGDAMIGGVLSTNAGGTSALRYGSARALCLALEVVLADGRRLDLTGGLRKDNAGYDLKQLFIGSEGTLGVITAATLGLAPALRDVATALAGVADPTAAMAMFRALRDRVGPALTTFELMPRFGYALSLRHIGRADALEAAHPWYLLVELSSPVAGGGLDERLSDWLAAMLEDGLAADATLAANERQRADLWRLRDALSDAQGLAGASIKHDVSVPLSRIAGFIEETSAACTAALEGLRPCVFGHLGDGNLHFNLSQPEGMDRAAFLALWPRFNRIVHDRVIAAGGSIAAEHGVGIQKRDELLLARGPVAIGAMRAIKAALDPRGILNPGKVI
jgi:FAD/FMN-containing dehydrogenase